LDDSYDRELARRAGWKQPYVARIERGDAVMISALEGLEAFAKAANTTAVVLFLDTETATVREQVTLGESPAPALMNQTFVFEASELVQRMRLMSEQFSQFSQDLQQLRMQPRIAALRPLRARGAMTLEQWALGNFSGVLGTCLLIYPAIKATRLFKLAERAKKIAYRPVAAFTQCRHNCPKAAKTGGRFHHDPYQRHHPPQRVRGLRQGQRSCGPRGHSTHR